ncbi:septum formation initiator family protein [Lactobacillus sp. ESL0228]|uniref:FtsB family cell division protein n=1 Tax=Lactobacillus sp. ESL0228 TaxID=2069352 RepID=UPI000EFCCFB8|nr:septum formation initiator family protein [Lactobacillus sp. ESL0228]RMC47622.1 septum formation initiator family protein [Lactobacillus sp. ESL0228]
MMKGPRIYNSLSSEEQVARLKQKQIKREKEIHRVRRNRIVAVFVILFTILSFQIVQTCAQTKQIKQQVQTSKKSLNQINEEKRSLTVKRDDLKDPEYVTKLIRSKFLYSKPNETIYNLPEGTDQGQ